MNVPKAESRVVNTYKPSFSWPGIGTAVKKRKKTSNVNKMSITRSDTNQVSDNVIMSWKSGETQS